MRCYEQTIEQMRTICRQFDDLNDLLDFADTGIGYETLSTKYFTDDAEMGISTRSHFLGKTFTSWKHALATASAGDSAAAQTISELMDAIADIELPAPSSPRRRPNFDFEDGDEIDMDRLRTGQPVWRGVQRAEVVGQKTVTLIADICTPGAKDSDEVMWRGVCAFVIADRLERAGYSVEIIVAENTGLYLNNGQKCNALTWVTVKRLGDPFDMSSLGTCVSGWCYRTAWFMASMGSPRCFNCDENMGSVKKLTPQCVAEITPDDNAFVIRNVWGKHESINYIRHVLATVVMRNELHEPDGQAAEAESMPDDAGKSPDIKPQFELGRVMMTRGLIDAIGDSDVGRSIIAKLIARHANCDWGDLDLSDQQANRAAMKLVDGEYGRIVSKYTVFGQHDVFVITEADRSVTTALLTTEY